jgi:hypothetical protein
MTCVQLAVVIDLVSDLENWLDCAKDRRDRRNYQPYVFSWKGSKYRETCNAVAYPSVEDRRIGASAYTGCRI